jgi:2-dehydro-3-deoxyglucarate aldolase/4-hydroxy-2-oxoheptanedioate aldolase
MKSNVKTRLKNGEKIIGTMITAFSNPEIVKMLKVVGFDLFIVDCEHGPFDFSEIAGLFAMGRECGIAPMIRIPEVRREIVLKAMEMGAAGILVPSVESVQTAKDLITYSKYAPMGNRGVSLLRGHTGWEKTPPAPEYMKQQNEDSLLMTQIESPAGVAIVDELMALDGIDALFVGPNDLSQSLGIMGQMDHPKFHEAMEKIIAAAKKAGKYSGIHMMATDALAPWIAKGMTLNLWSNEVMMMMTAAREGLAKLKG